MSFEPDPYVLLAARRALVQGESRWAQLTFDVAVLDRYRGERGYSVIRTDTAGRLRKEGGWSLDFGIGQGDATLHASLGDLLDSLPEGERDHWAMHVFLPGASPNFLRMRLNPSSCFDDGEVRAWD